MWMQAISRNLYASGIGRKTCAQKRMYKMRQAIYDLGKEIGTVIEDEIS
jgi:hypothetical protein